MIFTNLTCVMPLAIHRLPCFNGVYAKSKKVLEMKSTFSALHGHISGLEWTLKAQDATIGERSEAAGTKDEGSSIFR